MKWFFTLILFLVAIFYRPIVVQDAWLWFVTPLGLNPLGYWHAWGLSNLLFFLVYPVALDIRTSEINKAVSDGDGKDNKFVLAFVHLVFYAWAHLIFWLVNFGM